MRSKRRNLKNRFSQPARRRQSLTLEQLDSRLLLSATTEWLDPIENAVENISGYGVPDLTFSEPFLWDNFDNNGFVGPLSSADYLNILNQIEQDYLDQYFNDLDQYTPQTTIDTSGNGGEDYASAATATGAYTLFLDFDGARVYSRSGDFWLGSDYVDIPAYDLSSFGWGGMEEQSIDLIVDFIREDYAAYNINITTQQPAGSDYTTIYVGGTNEWFRAGSGVIGVATYDVGNTDASNYGFAFSEELGVYTSYCGGDVDNYSEYLANLIAHEAAHTYGSNHVNDVTAMMNPYLPISPRTQMFGEGYIPNTSTYHDTQSLLGANIGYKHGQDDYGDAAGTAQSININSTIAGLLERRDDIDTFRFTPSQSGTVTVDIDTVECGNLDSTLTVTRNSDSTTIAYNDDYGGSLDSCVSFYATAGQSYTIAVAGLSGNTSGTYALELTSEAPVPTPVIEVTDSVGSGSDHAVDFGTVTIETDNTAQITIANLGNDNLVISELVAAGNFQTDITSQASNSSDDLTIAPYSEQTITITFSPEEIDNYEGLITITSNDADNALIVVNLTGQAIGPQPNIDLNAGTEDLNDGDWNFGTVIRNVPTSRTVTLVNTGQADLNISGLYISSNYKITTGYDSSIYTIAPQQSRDITIEVTGTQRGDLDGVLVINSNDPDQPSLRVEISAEVAGGLLAVQDSSSSASDQQIDFDNIDLNTSATQTVTLSNAGDGPLTITGIELAGEFQLGTQLDPADSLDDITLDAGETITVNVGFSPNEMADYAGAITITTDDPLHQTSTVTLAGQGVAGILEVSEIDGLDDGECYVGTITTGSDVNFEAWRLTNNGNIPVTVNLALATGRDFELVGNDTIILAAGQSHIISVQANTQLACNVSDTLMLSADDLAATCQNINLSADGYALVGNGQRYQFTDHTGDRVTISLAGEGLAKVTIGSDGQPDIYAIDLTDTADTDNLSIRVAGRGRTSLGSITGDGDLKSIIANKVDLLGDGIDINGSLGQLQLGHVLEGDVRFSSDSGAIIRLEQVISNSLFDIDGDILKFQAVNLVGSTIECDAIGRMNITENFDSDITTTRGGLDDLRIISGNLAGSIQSAGNIFNVTLAKGDLTGQLNTQTAIDRITAQRGTVSGQINAGQSIGRINALNIDNADISAAQSIDQIIVKNEMLDSLVAVGPNTLSESAKVGTLNAGSNDTWLGSLKVNGKFSGTTIAVGVEPDEQGNFLNGTSTAGTGAIDRVDLRNVDTLNGSDPFGLCARDTINKITINRQKITNEFQQDDFYIAILNN